MSLEKKFNPKDGDPLISDSHDMFFEMISRKNKNKEGEKLSPLDFLGIPSDVNEKSFYDLASILFGIEKNLITDGDKKTFSQLEKAYSIGKSFLKNTLHYSGIDKIEPLTLNSKEDLHSLLEKSKLPNKNKKSFSSIEKEKSLIHFRLIKSTVVAYETLKVDFLSISKTNDNFKRKMWDSEEIIAPFTLDNSDKSEYKVFLKYDKTVSAIIHNRKKFIESAMLRFFNRSESNAKKALEDGIGFRVYATKKDASAIIPSLSNWLIKNNSVSFINFENKSFFNVEELNKLTENINKYVSEGNREIQNDVSSNATSAGIFKSFVLKGILEERLNLKEAGEISSNVRQFEIQFVLPESSNESGFSHHSIYTLNKILFARTRIDGGVLENDFNKLVKMASDESGMKEKDIINYLTSEDSSKKVKIKKERYGKTYIYKANAVLDRWTSLGLT